MKNINQLAIDARNALQNGDQSAFNTLYKYPALMSLKQALVKKYTRKSAILNPHDLEALFDDSILHSLDRFNDNFIAFLKEDFRRRVARTIQEHHLIDKRRANYSIAAEIVNDFYAMEDTDDSRRYHIPVAPNNTEAEALLNIMCEELNEQDALMVHAIYDGRVKQITEVVDFCAYKNRQQAYRAIERVKKIAA